jgi:hypothetical protein
VTAVIIDLWNEQFGILRGILGLSERDREGG